MQKHETTTWVEMEVTTASLLLITSMLKSCKTLPMLTESILLIQGIRCQKIESLSITKQMKWLILSKYFACENNYSIIGKNIPLRILNTFNHENKGTLITFNSNASGIKTLSVLENVSLVNLEGRGLLGKTGVDARIFRVMGDNDISVSIISGSSERGIGLWLLLMRQKQ
jgi:hypothetical protein